MQTKEKRNLNFLTGLFKDDPQTGKRQIWMVSALSSLGRDVSEALVQLLSPGPLFATPNSPPGSSILHYLGEFAQIHAHWVGDAIQPPLPLPPPSFAFSLSQHPILNGQNAFWACFSSLCSLCFQPVGTFSPSGNALTMPLHFLIYRKPKKPAN